MLAEVANSWEEKGAYEGMTDSLKDKYGERFSDAAIQHAMYAAAAGLEPEAQRMRDSMKDADYMGYGETSYLIMEMSGWPWVTTSHDVI